MNLHPLKPTTNRGVAVRFLGGVVAFMTITNLGFFVSLNNFGCDLNNAAASTINQAADYPVFIPSCSWHY